MRPCIPPPRPSEHADGGDAEYSALQPARRGRRFAVPVEQLTINIRRLTRRHVTRARPPLGCRDPTADVDERLGAAHGACLLIVKLLTVETEPRNMELHRFSVADGTMWRNSAARARRSRVQRVWENDPSSASSHTPGSRTTVAGSASAGMLNVDSRPVTCSWCSAGDNREGSVTPTPSENR
jgi:hypothetical protein